MRDLHQKFTSQGLEQEFNLLDAQRERCTAYAKAQGWSVTEEAYDDGGEAPAPTSSARRSSASLPPTSTRKIEVVVVYKVDRLSRSLLDFA